jgi:hypothetical protein
VSRTLELALAGDRVLELLREPAARLAADPESQIDLIHTIGATAHGFATFLAEGIFGDPAGALEVTARKAGDAARRLAGAVAPEHDRTGYQGTGT